MNFEYTVPNCYKAKAGTLSSPRHREARLLVGYVTASKISYVTLPHPLPHRRHHMCLYSVARVQPRQNQRRDLDQ